MKISDVKKKNISYVEIKELIKVLLNDKYESFLFLFDELSFSGCFSNFKSLDNFQISISKKYELSTNQKKNGIFYTPSDLCDYIVVNSAVSLFNDSKDEYISEDKAISFLMRNGHAKSFVFEKKLFDPTSGAGDFLVSALKLKLYLLNTLKPNYDIEDVLSVLKTIKGNDIDSDANSISQIRLLLIASYFLGYADVRIADILKSNFTKFDFLTVNQKDIKSFDLIVGNPPYIEKKRLSKYGNIYADILENASIFLKKKGVLGFVIPLSYVATPRMKGIRNYIENTFKKQLILNFSDRPASLFPKVHQKITIIIATNNSVNHGIYVSDYRYFYKNFRNEVFLRNKLVKIENIYDFYPKFGVYREAKILSKIYTNGDDCIFALNQNSGSSIYLNMRVGFWNKAFTFLPGSNEYKEFKFKTKIRDYILCILNSSLFWYFWIKCSDCWHITDKELKTFRIILNSKVDFKLFTFLASKLEKKLEDTKKFVGTKQTLYVYKHKCCKDIIDEIDNNLARIYGLKESEIEFIKNYSLEYRLGKRNEQ